MFSLRSQGHGGFWRVTNCDPVVAVTIASMGVTTPWKSYRARGVLKPPKASHPRTATGRFSVSCNEVCLGLPEAENLGGKGGLSPPKIGGCHEMY